MMSPRISVILSTYEWPEALAFVLRSLSAQTIPPHEVVVADDGSGAATRECVGGFAMTAPFQVQHVWQPDEGFRAAAARNRAAARATGDILLFLDGDCIADPRLIESHGRLAEPGWQLVGNRMLLSRSLTQAVLNGDVDPAGWTLKEWIDARLRGRVNRLSPLLRLADGAWRKWFPHRWQGAQTCNLSVWREDFCRVNGFDETYQGWGHEDADLVVRLMATGCRRKDARFTAPVLHLWHAHSPRHMETENRLRLEQALSGASPSVAAKGLDQYLPV